MDRPKENDGRRIRYLKNAKNDRPQLETGRFRFPPPVLSMIRGRSERSFFLSHRPLRSILRRIMILSFHIDTKSSHDSNDTFEPLRVDLDQAFTNRPNGRLGSVADGDLTQNVLNVLFDRFDTDFKRSTDLFVA